MLFEDIVRRKDIGAGIGGNFGRFEGMLMGGLAGTVLGAKASGLGLKDVENMDFSDVENTPVGPLVGAYLGTGLGTALGGQIGRAIGKNVISNPEGAADFSKPSHRVGYLANPNTKWYGALSDMVVPGAGSTVGAIRNAISNDGAKRVGYETPGRFAQILSGPVGYSNILPPISFGMGSIKYGEVAPLLGIIPPDKIAKNKK